MAATTPQGVERRMYPRYEINSEVLATLLPGRARQGQINDISEGGLAFNYISAGDWADVPSAIDIFSDDGQIALTNIPCKSVRDITLEEDEPTKLLHLRKHAVQFGELTARHRSLLNTLIQKYALIPG